MNKREVWALQLTKKPVGLRWSVLAQTNKQTHGGQLATLLSIINISLIIIIISQIKARLVV